MGCLSGRKYEVLMNDERGTVMRCNKVEVLDITSEQARSEDGRRKSLRMARNKEVTKKVHGNDRRRRAGYK